MFTRVFWITLQQFRYARRKNKQKTMASYLIIFYVHCAEGYIIIIYYFVPLVFKQVLRVICTFNGIELYYRRQRQDNNITYIIINASVSAMTTRYTAMNLITNVRICLSRIIIVLICHPQTNSKRRRRLTGKTTKYSVN